MSQAAPRIFSPDYYARLREVEERHWWSVGMREVAAALLAPHLPALPGCPVMALDAGCGTGVTLAWLSGLRGDATHLVGIDVAPEGLAHCRERGQRLLAQASVLALPYPAETFGMVLSVDVLQHLPFPDGDRQALAEAYRVLRPGGVLFIRANARRPGNPPAAVGGDYRRYELDELGASVRANGFRIERLTYANRLSTWLERVRVSRRHEGTGHGEAHAHGHGADAGLRIRCLPAGLGWANALLAAMLGLEAAYLARPGRRLARGHSTMCVAVKP